MKITITDKFLWDLYSVLEGVDDAVRFWAHPSRALLDAFSDSQNPIFEKYRKEMGIRRFQKIIYYLKRKHYIVAQELKGKQAIMLTKEGISKALKASFEIDGVKKRKDGKWIMLTFDIPQNHKKPRELLRSIIRNLGYKMFQQSIWICPFDVSDITEKLLQMHGLEKYVKVFLIEKL